MSPEIKFDPAQQQAIDKLAEIERTILARFNDKNNSWWKVKRVNKKHASARGLYLWGGVGRGKTMLMDQFYEQLALEQKTRLHFHRFMQLVHEHKAELKDVQDPIGKIADRFADQAILLCLDEMHISDITDAMLMARLLERLFERGVVVVTTSNAPPDDLYKNGLQRSRFLPAIDLMNTHLEVFNLDSGIDYRLLHLTSTAIYSWPHDHAVEKTLAETFELNVQSGQTSNAPVTINTREIPVIQRANGILWCSFEALCEGNRATADYIEIGRLFHTVICQDVPQLDDSSNDPARRLISMIDEFYDRRVNFIVSAAVPLNELYSGKKLAFAFERTSSRLHEMQAEEYLSAAHVP